jgi:hypothetical protein
MSAPLKQPTTAHPTVQSTASSVLGTGPADREAGTLRLPENPPRLMEIPCNTGGDEASEPQRHVSEHLNPDCQLGHATHRENSHGALHATAIRNPPPADGCCTRKTCPAASSGRALGKRRVTAIFERRGISVLHRSRRPWALTLCATVSTSPVFLPWNLTNAGCRRGYLRSVRRSSWNMGRSPATAVYALRTVSFNWLSASLSGFVSGGFSRSC